MMHKIIAVLVAAIVAGTLAYAGQGTVNYTSSGTSPFRTTTDTTSTGCSAGTPCNLSNVVIFDPTTNTQGLAISAAGAASVGGTTSNGSSSVAITSANVPSVAWNYMFNGTTWDQLRGDTTNGVWVNVKAAAANASTNIAQWSGTNITNVPTAVGTAGTGNTPTLNSYIVGCVSPVCNSNGQAVMASSAPVVIASNQSAVASNINTWGGTAITNVPTAVGTVGTGNTPTVNAYIVGSTVATGGTSSNFGSVFPTPGTAMGAEYLSSPPTYVSGNMVALQTTVNGSLHTTVDNAATPGSATAANSSPVVSAQTTPVILNGMTNTAKTIKASAGQLVMLQCYNPNTAAAYVLVYNNATPTIGSGNVLGIGIAPSSTGGFALPGGMQFSTAITASASTAATAGSAPTTPIDCNASYM